MFYRDPSLYVHLRPHLSLSHPHLHVSPRVKFCESSYLLVSAEFQESEMSTEHAFSRASKLTLHLSYLGLR